MIMQQVEIRGGHGGERSAQFLQLGDFVFVGHRVAVAIHPQVGSVGRDFLGFAFEEPENCSPRIFIFLQHRVDRRMIASDGDLSIETLRAGLKFPCEAIHSWLVLPC